MIILIDASVVGELNIGNVSSSIENLASARAEALHFVIADIEVINAVLSMQLSDRGRRVMLYMRNKYAQEILWGESAQSIIRVVGSNYYTPRRRNEQLININFFSLIDSVLSTQLLCEDETDAFILKGMIKKYIEINSNLGFNKIALDPIHGGGSRLPRNFETLKKKNRFILAVVDSDKRFPKDSNRNCAKIMEEKEKESSFPFYAGLVVLKCHEVENLIPVRHLRELYSNKIDFFAFLDKVIESDRLKYSVNYIDYKKGIKSHLNSNNPAEIKFWSDVVNKIDSSIEECSIIAGLGVDIADKYRELISSDLQYFDEDFNDNFRITADKIAYFGAAPMSLST